MDATNRYMDNLLFIWTKLFLSCYKTDNKIHKLTSYSLRKRSKSFQNPFLMLFKVYNQNAENAELALVKLMELFNHSSVAITKRYLGLRQEEILQTYDSLSF